MAKCVKCGKNKLFQKVNALGFCKECELTAALEVCQRRCSELADKQEKLGFTEYEQTMAAVAELKEQLSHLEASITDSQERLSHFDAENEKASKQLKTSLNRLARSKEIYKAICYAIDNFSDNNAVRIDDSIISDLDELSPSVILKLHCLDIKDLRKAFRDNDKQIEQVMSLYAARYTTKANQTIYKLMVIALRAELQNILYNLKYEKLDTAIEQVKEVTSKYLKIASEGNQSIAGTLSKFIGEMEYLFINAVKIEYNYYVKKEQARQEQLAIREQMRQEAEERKALEAEKKRIEAEESKYESEIKKAQEAMLATSEAEKAALHAKILELQQHLSEVVVKKDDIVKLQNGKAGNIYIISNLGAFGENMFKVGMTRRINPQDRVDELGDASVPFKFDVHSFIFSEDAVALESKLHSILDSKRVNKVNLRKEFFYSSVDELERIVLEIDPTAEFTRTMLAEEYRQSLSSSENYSTDYTLEDDEE